MFHLPNQQKEEAVKRGQYQANLISKQRKTLIGLIGKQNVIKLYDKHE